MRFTLLILVVAVVAKNSAYNCGVYDGYGLAKTKEKDHPGYRHARKILVRAEIIREEKS